MTPATSRAALASRLPKSTFLAVALSLGTATCGSTGGDLLEFDAFAAGPEDAVAGDPYVFETDRGFKVTLTKAKLHIGAVYLNSAVQTSVASDTSCYLSSLYVAEVAGGIDVDVLDPTPQPFSVRGFATTERAATAEVWLSGGNIEADHDPTIIADIEGTAEQAGHTYPFQATITIGENRKLAPPSEAQPGFNPICKQRIVTPIDVDIAPREGGHLMVRIDPAAWFGNVRFDLLEKISDDPPLYGFHDDDSDQPSRNLYGNLRANAGVYDFSWEE